VHNNIKMRDKLTLKQNIDRVGEGSKCHIHRMPRGLFNIIIFIRQSKPTRITLLIKLIYARFNDLLFILDGRHGNIRDNSPKFV